jgi:pimeloyl-ACP methyl ester carboxylesterase
MLRTLVARPLVLVHGLSASSRWWGPSLPLLAAGRDVVAVDVPRYGRRFRPHETADWLARRIAHLGPVDLLGHSLGGLVCADLASDRPDQVGRLVLVAPVGAPRPPARLYELPPVALARTALRATPRLLFAMTTDALRWGPEALLHGGLFATRERFCGSVAAPTLLVWGTRDRLVPAALAGAWRELIPHARLELISGARHAPMIEAPQAFAQAVLEFLDEPGDERGVRPMDGVGGPGNDDEAAGGNA